MCALLSLFFSVLLLGTRLKLSYGTGSAQKGLEVLEVDVLQASVVQRLENVIQRINHYPVDSVVCFVNTYPLDSDLSGG